MCFRGQSLNLWFDVSIHVSVSYYVVCRPAAVRVVWTGLGSVLRNSSIVDVGSLTLLRAEI